MDPYAHDPLGRDEALEPDQDRIGALIAILRDGDREERLRALHELAGHGSAAFRARGAILAAAKQGVHDDELFQAALQAAGAVAMAHGQEAVEALERLERTVDGSALAGDPEDADPLGEAAFMIGASLLAGALYLTDAIFDRMGLATLTACVLGSVSGTWLAARVSQGTRDLHSWLVYVAGGAGGVLLLTASVAAITGTEGGVVPFLAIFGAIVGCGGWLIARGRRGPFGKPPPDLEMGTG